MSCLALCLAMSQLPTPKEMEVKMAKKNDFG